MDYCFSIFLNIVGFANGSRDLGSVPGRVIPKTQKMVLGASLLNTQHNKIRIKGKLEQSRERSSAFYYTLEELGSPSTTVANFTLMIYLSIYINIYIGMFVFSREKKTAKNRGKKEEGRKRQNNGFETAKHKVNSATSLKVCACVYVAIERTATKYTDSHWSSLLLLNVPSLLEYHLYWPCAAFPLLETLLCLGLSHYY